MLRCSVLLLLFVIAFHTECYRGHQQTLPAVSPSIQLDLNPAVGSFSISVNHSVWFTSGPITVYTDGAWSSTEDGSLKRQNCSSYQGYDSWGPFDATKILWRTIGGVSFYTVFKVYREVPAIAFEQLFGNGAQGTAVQGSVMSSFPTLNLTGGQSGQYGFLTYSGNSRWTGITIC